MGINAEDIDWQALGRALRERREQAGTPADVAARQMCLAKPQILALENGNASCFPGSDARLWCARRYAAQLGLSIDAFSKQSVPPVAPVPTPNKAVAIPPPVAEPVTENLPEPPPASDEDADHRPATGIGKRIAVAMVLLLLLVMGVFSLSSPPASTPQAPKVVSEAPSPVVEPVPAQSVQSPEPADSIPPAPVAEPVVAEPPIPAPQATPPVVEVKAPPSEQVVEVQGINPEKSPRSLFIAVREPVVLVTKRPGKSETTLTLEKGAARRIDLSGDETMRVAQGKDLDMYFQGRKVWSGFIEAGQWLRFVPLKPAATP